MFLENQAGATRTTGWIELVSGSMFSGKTEELLRRLRRAKIAKLKVEIFKPAVDVRYSNAEVVSHDSNSIQSIVVTKSTEIIALAQGYDVVGIDEAQFFDEGLIEVCNQLANNGVRVVVAGLDMDFLGHPFGPMPGLLAIAEYVTKVHAICMQCGQLAHYSHRLAHGGGLVVLGEKDVYEPLCRDCFNKLSTS